jgi:hypothetical protein
MTMLAHPAADIWPLMAEAELLALAADLRERGQVLPIIRVGGKILDGRNRYLACQRIGIKPWVEDIECDDPAALAWSLNDHRRHLNEGVRAMAAARRANMQRGDNQWVSPEGGTSQAEAAQLFGVNIRTVQRAKSVLAHGNTVIIDAVSTGKIQLTTAAAVVKKINQGDAFPINSLTDLHKAARQLWVEHQTAKSRNAFEILKIVTDFAHKNPANTLVTEYDDWNKLSLLEKIVPVLEYLTDLRSALKETATSDTSQAA